MKRRELLAGVAATGLASCAPEKPKKAAKPVVQAAASSSSSSTKSSNPLVPEYITPPDVVRLEMVTSKGTIVLQLDGKHAPITVANFLNYVDNHKLDGATFWRASRVGDGSGFIQARAAGIKYPPIAHEPTTKTGLSHTNGVISMARFDVGTATNEFTICIGDQTYLDAGRDPKGDNLGYAAFGRVVKGMAVVKAILNSRIAKGKAEPGGWDGQMIAKPVEIISAKRVG
jgi:peptidyl-prolyl cis-trans isomerase A (cyclophilin A)